MRESVLIVDDEAGIRDALTGILEDEHYSVRTARSVTEARILLNDHRPDVVLLDLWLPDTDGMTLLEELQQQQPDLPVIVISGHGNIDSAVRATRLGAYDFLEKPPAMSRILLTVRNALDKAKMKRQLAALSQEVQRSNVLIGESPAMLQLKEQLERAARSDSRILIIGENGTGKELVAREIHRLSQRSGGPFVEINCAAIPEELIESELFGHVKGAFTGASADRAGRFEQADGGTLFLDEIADMSLKTQAKVLRALQEQRFERVGSTRSIQVDVRVVAATNKDLQDEIRENRFREDLYFRLAVIPLMVPPLRERPEDVPLLVDHFIHHFASEFGHRPKRMARASTAQLVAHPWPGNVRELRNFVERMMIMVPGEEIQPEDLPEQMQGETSERLRILLNGEDLTFRQARAAFEKRFIERKLRECGGNVSRTAALLELERSHLYRKIRAYGIEVRRGEPARV